MRQGSVPSPVLFVVYIDDIAVLASDATKPQQEIIVILHADDIIIIMLTAPSILEPIESDLISVINNSLGPIAPFQRYCRFSAEKSDPTTRILVAFPLD